VFSIRAELGLDGDVDMLFAGLEAGLDGASLEILVNNAGVLDFTPSRASCCAPSANVRSGIWPVGSAKARRGERATAQPMRVGSLALSLLGKRIRRLFGWTPQVRALGRSAEIGEAHCVPNYFRCWTSGE